MVQATGIEYVKKMIDELGEDIAISTPVGTWMVPRMWIAENGLKAWELPELAKKNGWKKV